MDIQVHSANLVEIGLGIAEDYEPAVNASCRLIASLPTSVLPLVAAQWSFFQFASWPASLLRPGEVDHI